VFTRSVPRSRLVSIIALGLMGTLLASGVAVASTGKPGASYSGTGKDYMNNAPIWTVEATGQFSYQVSASGREITNFRGGFSYYCGAGKSFVSAKSMTVSASGSFSYRFSVANVVNGKSYGRNYVSIAGSFNADGSSASISYLFDSVGTNVTVRDPYNTAYPHKLGCASWVKGTARAQ
jgi:hypothetical protein